MTYKIETDNFTGVIVRYVIQTNIPLKRNKNSGSNIKNIKITKLPTK